MFAPVHLTQWRRGGILSGEPDTIPADALRRADNVRTDRTEGAICSRPGWTRKTAATIASQTITWLSKLYGSNDWSYVQTAGSVYRLTDSWTGATVISASGDNPISDANLSDGQGTLYKYLVNSVVASKDNGTTTTTMGIAAPTAAPLSAALATDLSTTINAMDDHTQWAGTAVSGKADDTAIQQEGTGSVTFQIAASTWGSIGYSLAADLDIDTLTGGDDAVKDDDYIHVWIRFDRPDYVVYAQLEFDLDTNVVANAFRTNYYSVRLPSATWFNQATDQWTKIQVRKSQFARFGTDTAKTWAAVQAVRLSFLTNASGTVTVHVDDMKLRGGTDLEGEIEYTAVYRNSSTMARGNPPTNSDGAVLYTTKVPVDRHRVNVDISNIIQGGANHPGDTQIDQIMLFRRGSAFPTATLAETLNDTATSPHLDAIADNTLLLLDAVTTLETDNDVPPSGSSRVLFGPDAQGVLFLIVDGVRIYFSKAFEVNENRAENWGRLNFFLAGDGAQRAVAGLTRDTERYFWTERATFQIVGIGINTFLPVEIPGSRGVVGQYAVTSGAGRLFFRAPDGIYEQRGLQQIKLTGAIDPFFNGEPVNGHLPENTDTGVRAQMHLAYFADPAGSMLVMPYATANEVVPTRLLILKQDPETGLHTQAYFDTSNATAIRSLMVDDEDLELLGGGHNGDVYRIEDNSTNDDDGTAIPIRARTVSVDGGLPAQDKHVAQITVEGDTGGTAITATAYHDRGSVPEALGSASSTSPTGVMHLATTDATARHHDTAVEITAATTTKITLSRITLHMAPLPERVQTLDTDELTFADRHLLREVWVDIEAEADITVQVYVHDTLRDTRPVLVAAGRAVLKHELPAGLKGQSFRLHLTSALPFRVYNILGHFRQLGSQRGYQRLSFMRAA